MAIKEKIREKIAALANKLQIGRFKFHYLILAIIAISIPLTVIATQYTTENRTRASTIQETLNLQDQSTVVSEDNPPIDSQVANDPAVLNEANTIDSLASTKVLTNKPNVVVIMLDDLNPIDGRFWIKSRTPSIYNAIISKGINFTNFYVETPLCCPGRAGFLSGQHTQNHKVVDLNGQLFNPSMTLPVKLQGNGYFTILVGKYLNGFTNLPVPEGWNKFDGVYGQQGYYNYTLLSKGNIKTTYGQTAKDYSTDVFANLAMKRIKEAPANKPIFAYIAPVAPHSPYTSAPRHKDDARCLDIGNWKVSSSYEPDVSDKPAYIREITDVKTNGYNIKPHCETILAVDDLVRRVKNELARQNRLNNTIFILTADNGMAWGEHRLWAKTVPYTTHVPFYVAWPYGRGTSPRIERSILSNVDLAATICNVAGCVMGPYPNGQQNSDGISFLPLLKDAKLTSNRDAILESEPVVPTNNLPKNRPAWWGIRTTGNNGLGLWHYVEYETGERELYKLSNKPCYQWRFGQDGDPCELKNILKPGSVVTADTQNIINYLTTKLSELKKEKGYK